MFSDLSKESEATDTTYPAPPLPPPPLLQSMLTEFNKENEAFINSKKSPSEAVAPWVGYADEETLKEQILALSTVGVVCGGEYALLISWAPDTW